MGNSMIDQKLRFSKWTRFNTYNLILKMTQFPARIHILLARDEPLGLVIRRGPSKYVATILWNRSYDEFQLGQWLKGKIYERRSDLSHDGKYFIYFAMNGKWDGEAKGSWTAISRAPYLKALAIFPRGNCWNGGGLWTKRQKNKNYYWLNYGYGHDVLWNTTEVLRDEQFRPSGGFGNNECLGVYYPRLLRDGWQFKERIRVAKWQERDIFEKPLKYGWLLRKIAHAQTDPPEGKGCYWDEHELIHPKSDTQVKYPNWEWAELDERRLVWATEGKLFCGNITSSGINNEQELYDFNSMEFEPIEAPY